MTRRFLGVGEAVNGCRPIGWRNYVRATLRYGRSR